MAQGALKSLAQAKWRSSGLTDAHAKKLRLQGLSGERTKAMAMNFKFADSLLIPYFKLNGKPSSFFRVRYLGKLPGWDGMSSHPQRYDQPARTLNEVYLPPLMKDRTWEQVSKDASIEVLITEGELKAAAGTAAGFPTMGLGGVDTWQAKKQGLGFLPALDAFKWKGRVVWVVFDSDAAIKPAVASAQRRLLRELLERGARPNILTLPPGPRGEKQGLDDYLLTGGKIETLISNAPSFSESDALWAFNEEVLLARDPGFIIERETGKHIDFRKFTDSLYANRHYIEITPKGDGFVSKKKPLAQRWLAWEGRAEVPRLVYSPGAPRLHNGGWNTWPGWGCEPKKGDVTPWEWLLAFLFRSDPKSIKWFEQWCAYPIQNPGTKLYTSALLWGLEKGTGKTLIAYSLMKIYGKNGVEVKSKTFKSEFNSWAKDRQFVYGDEITGGQARVDADWLKGLITQHSVTIREMYLPPYVVDDCMNYYFGSNHPDALFLEDGDRRFFVHEVKGKPAPRQRYEVYDQWLKSDGPSALFWHLLHVNLKGFNPREHAPDTLAKQAMIFHGKGDLAAWCQWLREDPATALKPLGTRLAEECDLFPSEFLLRAFDPDKSTRFTTIGLGRTLVAAGCVQVCDGTAVKTAMGFRRLFAVRNQSRWVNAKYKDVVKHFNKYFGDQDAKFRA